MLHTINPEILFLKQEDVIKAGLLDMKQILAVTEKTYAMLGQGLIKNPPKTNTSIPDKENWQSFFNAMPSAAMSTLAASSGRRSPRRTPRSLASPTASTFPS